jgi:hypothetical protein
MEQLGRRRSERKKRRTLRFYPSLCGRCQLPFLSIYSTAIRHRSPVPPVGPRQPANRPFLVFPARPFSPLLSDSFRKGTNESSNRDRRYEVKKSRREYAKSRGGTSNRRKERRRENEERLLPACEVRFYKEEVEEATVQREE